MGIGVTSATKAKLLVFAVFLGGALTGVLVDNVYQSRSSADADVPGETGARRAVKQVHDLLDLTPEQRQQWDKIMQDSKPEFDRLWDENRKITQPTQAKFEELREQTRSKIRGILTDDQKRKYDENNDRRRQRQFRSRQD